MVAKKKGRGVKALRVKRLTNGKAKTVKGGAGYMKLGDIKRESTTSGHEKWIEVQSIGWAVPKR